ncbi:AAA family ATPase [Methanobacterium sp. YSL]|nr:AAA family ATPase [Methanobacterium sp. YSL]
MRIEKLILKNFRQYKDLEIVFPKNKKNDLHIIIGKNGTGKTTVLNAINWCLYGEEPHSSESTSKLPILNLNSVIKSSDSYQEVLVELWVTTDNDNYMIFQRTQPFRILSKNNIPIPQNHEFTVTLQDKIGNTKIVEDIEADMVAEHFVPSAIRDFFFFDGERLDNYFKEAKGKNIKHQIFILSHVYLLENMESRLDKLFKSLRKEAGKLNPDIDAKTAELELTSKKSDAIEKEIIKVERQKKVAENEIKSIEDNLSDMPDAKGLDSRRKKLNENKEEIIVLLDTKNAEKRKFLLESSKIINLWPSIDKSINIINAKRRTKEIPPTIDKELLKNTLMEENCKVCGRKLDTESKETVEKLLSSVKLSSTVVHELHSMENPLVKYKETVEAFLEQRKSFQKEIGLYQKQLETIEEEISEINEKLSGFNVEQIKTLHEERVVLEEANKINLIKLGSLEEQLKTNNKKIKKLQKELKKLIESEKRAIKIKKKLSFTSKALDVVLKTKESIMQETKRLIEFETKKNFFQLLWKKETFKNVEIDNDYTVSLINSDGFECLGSCSAAERELLALSFTLALHRISGFESPILIDTPVARVSDEHRMNFANIFSEVSQEKQIILLFTPAEFSEEIKDVLMETASKYEINLTSDEKEATIEVLL